MALPEGETSPLALLLHVLLVLCPVPNHLFLLVYLWYHRKQSEWPLLFCTPLNALALLFGAHATRILGASALLGALVQIVVMRQLRRQGLQLI